MEERITISLIMATPLVSVPFFAAASAQTSQPNPPDANSSQPITHYLSEVTVTGSRESPGFNWQNMILCMFGGSRTNSGSRKRLNYSNIGLAINLSVKRRVAYATSS